MKYSGQVLSQFIDHHLWPRMLNGLAQGHTANWLVVELRLQGPSFHTSFRIFGRSEKRLGSDLCKTGDSGLFGSTPAIGHRYENK